MINRELQIGIAFTAAATLITAGLVGFAVHSKKRQTIAQPIVVTELSTTELLQADRGKTVCRELLNRSGVNSDTLKASLVRLSTLSGESAFDQFLRLLESLDSESPLPFLRNLTSLSMFIAEDHQNSLRSQLVEHTQTESQEVIRRVAWASLIALDGSAVELFSTTSRESLVEVVNCLPLIDRFAVDGNLYNCIRPFILKRDLYGDELHSASIEAALNMPHLHSEFASDLAYLAHQPNCYPAVSKALATLPAASLPDSQLGIVAAKLIARIAELQSKKSSPNEIELLVKQCLEIGLRMPAPKRKRIENRLQQLFVLN